MGVDKIYLVLILKWHYLAPMNKKLIIDKDVADKKFNLRTTDKLFGKMSREALEKNVSVNVLINQVFSDRYKKK